MSRLLVLALLAGLLVPAAAPAAGGAKHSGRIVVTGGTEITLEELGPWKPGSRPIERVIELQPSTLVERVTRVATPARDRWPGGFEAMPLAARDLRAGEFATVTAERHGKKLVAISVTVVEAR